MTVLAMERWAYLAPLRELRALWRELREPRHRIRQPGGERRQDGTLASNQNRMGPLTMAARLYALGVVLDLQRRVNEAADTLRRPRLDLLNAEEEARIRELIAADTWPRGWTGKEPLATTPLEAWSETGSVQGFLPMFDVEPEADDVYGLEESN